LEIRPLVGRYLPVMYYPLGIKKRKGGKRKQERKKERKKTMKILSTKHCKN